MTRHDAGNAARAILASLAFTLLLFLEPSPLGLALGGTIWIVTFLWTAQRVLIKNGELFADVRIGTHVIARLLLVAGVLAVMSHHPAGLSPLAWVAASGLLALTAVEGLVRRVFTYRGNRIAHLPGVKLRQPPPALAKGYTVLALAAVPLLGAFAVVGVGGAGVAVPGNLWLLPPVVMAGGVVTVLGDARSRRNLSRVAYENLPAVLEDYAPTFVFYWDAPRDSAYQLGMWVPYLKRTGEPFFIVVRNEQSFTQALTVSDGVPIVLARTMTEMDRMLPSTLTTAFYSNNGMRNSHFVRYQHLSHVQLLHGDSDKVSSFNPVTAMFDRVYVAGQAGIDRYGANGVDIPPEKFRIVGRPQVESIELAGSPRRGAAPPVVLYAPTWRGYFADASYSSLPVARELFDQLLERNVSIVFRPHPYSKEDPELRPVIADLHSKLSNHTQQTGITHIFGDEAEVTMSVVDCFNACDVMISDVSSVVVDFLYSGKPFGIFSVDRSKEEFLQEFPLAAAAYVLRSDAQSWSAELDEMLGTDPLEPQRRGMRVHYLGDFPLENYADGFVSEARRQILTGEKPRAQNHTLDAR